jgi:hypothetical protein
VRRTTPHRAAPRLVMAKMPESSIGILTLAADLSYHTPFAQLPVISHSKKICSFGHLSCAKNLE